MTHALETYLDFGKTIAQEGGQMLLEHLDHPRSARLKTSAIDVVTEVDELVQEHLVGRIQHMYPDHGIVAEENNLETATNRAYVWFIDPIDGTTNYCHHLHYFAVSLALCYDNQPVVGVIYAPRMGEMFWASHEGGAFLDGRPMSVSCVAQLCQAVIATGFPYKRDPGTDNNTTEFSRVMPFVQGIRRCGAASLDLAHVAAGRMDGYWEFHLSPWDALAGEVMVREAGGQVSTVRPSGAMYGPGGVLATNGHLHKTLHALVMGEEYAAHK